MKQVRVGRRGVYSVLVGNPNSKTLLGRSIRRGKGVIKMDLQEVDCGIMDCFEVAQDKDRFRALVNAVMKIPVPYNAGKFT